MLKIGTSLGDKAVAISDDSIVALLVPEKGRFKASHNCIFTGKTSIVVV